jgi:hypothetical protein
MIIAKTNPKGIDYKIFELQNVLESVLCNTIDTRFNWAGIVAIYGKIQKTTRDGQTIPEVYIGKGEYTEPFIDDKKTASLGFFVNSETAINHVPIADVDLIITMDLNKAFGNTNRSTAKAMTQVYNAIQGYVQELGPIKEGINEVFRNFSKIKNLQPSEMSQWFIFSLNFKLLFDYKN